MVDKPEEEQKDGGAKGDNAHQTAGVADLIQEFRSFLTKYDAALDENRNHNHGVFTWTRRAAIGVFLYTALTLGIVVIALCQFHISRDTEQRQLRAYISLYTAELSVQGN